ncbi:hypothetical protein BDZ89DRAFT_1059464 [Hymenopellis radicata]|nr:hypothetical protein BDZ89DRAFT_1059464 [Hymenopellis radicata]
MSPFHQFCLDNAQRYAVPSAHIHTWLEITDLPLAQCPSVYSLLALSPLVARNFVQLTSSDYSYTRDTTVAGAPTWLSTCESESAASSLTYRETRRACAAESQGVCALVRGTHPRLNVQASAVFERR